LSIGDRWLRWVGLLIAVGLVRLASAQDLATDTRIAFVSERDGNAEIYLIRPDGSDPVNLTNHPASDTLPKWSPDGKRIAFLSKRNGTTDLFAMNADGSGVTPLASVVTDFAWSPDGTRIAYGDGKAVYLGDQPTISVVNADGSNAHPVAAGDEFAWSPDGTQLAVMSTGQRASAEPFPRLFEEAIVVSADGSEAILAYSTSFIATGHSTQPFTPIWYQDGSRVIFFTALWSGHRHYRGGRAVSVHPDGSDQVFLPELYSRPLSISPDGMRILWTLLPTQPGPNTLLLSVTDLSGTNAQRLSPASLSISDASWSPDGTHILGCISRLKSPGDVGLYLVAADGSERERLTSWDDYQPDWQPIPAVAPSMVFEGTLPAGLSIFAAPLRTDTLSGGGQTISVAEDGGVLMARHLIRLGSTVCVRLVDGHWEAVIGREGRIVFGRDFPIEAARGYVINLLSPIAITVVGTAHGTPAPASPASPSAVWAFAVAGRVEDATILPEGTRVRVRNTRLSRAVEAAIESDGSFAAALVDGDQQVTVGEGDLVVLELVARRGEIMGRTTALRVSPDDLRNASAVASVSARPERTHLLPNYPNPFNPETWIPYVLADSGEMTIRVFDTRGTLVRTLIQAVRPAGYYTDRGSAVYWNGSNDAGETVASGVYIVELCQGSSRSVRRVAIGR